MGRYPEGSYLVWSAGRFERSLGLVWSPWCGDVSGLILLGEPWLALGRAQTAALDAGVCSYERVWSHFTSMLFPSLPRWPQKPLQ